MSYQIKANRTTSLHKQFVDEYNSSKRKVDILTKKIQFLEKQIESERELIDSYMKLYLEGCLKNTD